MRGVWQSGGSCDVPCFSVKREMSSLAKLEREIVGFVVGKWKSCTKYTLRALPGDMAPNLMNGLLLFTHIYTF